MSLFPVWKPGIVAVAILGFAGTGAVARSDVSAPLLFRAGFDSGLAADYSAGEAEPVVRTGVEIEAVEGHPGGQAVLFEPGSRLAYRAPGNVNPHEGAVFARVRPSWVDPKSQYVINISGERGAGQFMLFFYQDGRLILRVYDADGKRSNLSSKVKILDGAWQNAWHDVGFAYDVASRQARLFIDGRLESEATLAHLPDLTGRLSLVGIGHYLGDGRNHFGGLVDDVRIYGRFDAVPGVVAASVPQPDSQVASHADPDLPGTVNAGFEQGLQGWRVEEALDATTIASVEDTMAPEGRRVLHIRHDLTRSSWLSQRVPLKPYASYLFSADVRVEHYKRSRMGLFLRVFSEGGQAGERYAESALSGRWQTKRFPFVTGETGVVTVRLDTQRTAGDIWLDNIRLRECGREELRRILGPGYGSALPRIPLRAGEASARVWYDELPVSSTVPSRVVFQLRHSLEQDVWERSRCLKLELPAPVAVLSPVASHVEKLDGRTRYTFTGDVIEKVGSQYWCRVDLIASRSVGNARVQFWAEWEGGRQKAVSAPVVFVTVPSVKQPRTLITGTTSYEHVPPLYDDYAALMRRLGFNRVNFWKLGQGSLFIKPLRDAGIEVDTEWSGMGDLRQQAQEIPEAQAVDMSGTRRPTVIDPSHRGTLYDLAREQVRSFAKAGFSGLNVDDEHINDWNGMDTCLCERCGTRWYQWLEANRPGLEPLAPAALLEDPLGYPLHYRAWWLFRAELVTEWYVGIREAFVEAVEQHGSRSTDKPYLTLQVTHPGYDRIKSSFKNPVGLQSVFDLIMPQFYTDAFNVHQLTRALVREVGAEQSCPTLCMGTARSSRFEWKPGQLRAQILEVLFAGARGYTTWSWPYSNLRIIAEVAATNGVVAEQEAMFTEGKMTDVVWTEQEFCTCTALEKDGHMLVLVGNYAADGSERVFVRMQPSPGRTWRELFSNAECRVLQGQQDVALEIPPGTCTLWKVE